MAMSRVIFEYLTLALEFASAAIIVFGILFSVVFAVIRLIKKSGKDKIYQSFRIMVGRCILLGLELLIAADIIRSLALQLTLQSVGLLGIIVLVRTFLSFSLEVEMNGRWPWQKE
jgi:uncharacterized membrane protein